MGLGRRVAGSTLRGVAGAMAMTGVRTLAGSFGLVDQTPPQEIAQSGAGPLLARVPPERREGAVEAFHWFTGAVAGAGFGLLPEPLRRVRWIGPAYGIAVLGGYELTIAPLLGLSPAQRDATERVVFIADHLLFGAVVGWPSGRPGRQAA